MDVLLFLNLLLTDNWRLIVKVSSINGNYSFNENEKLQGQGKITYLDGEVMEGNFFDGVLDGIGKIICANGKSSIEGEFRMGVFQRGKMTCSDGTTMEGDFKNWKLQGWGKVNDPDGTIAEGYFDEGLMNGEGEIFDPISRITKIGTFNQGALTGPGKLIYEDGRQEEVNFGNEE